MFIVRVCMQCLVIECVSVWAWKCVSWKITYTLWNNWIDVIYMCLSNLLLYFMKLDYSLISYMCVLRLWWCRRTARNMRGVVPTSCFYWHFEDFLLFPFDVVIWLACMSSTLYWNFTHCSCRWRREIILVCYLFV